MNPDTAPVTLVAATLKSIEAKGHVRTPGSVVEYCDRCKTPVSVGPKAQAEIAARPGSRVLCVDCSVMVAKAARGPIVARHLRAEGEEGTWRG